MSEGYWWQIAALSNILYTKLLRSGGSGLLTSQNKIEQRAEFLCQQSCKR